MPARSAAALGAVAVLAAVLGTLSAPALACSCPEPPPPRTELVQADAVFAGEVTSIRGDDLRLQVVMDVADVWAGEIHERQLVMTEADSAMCGVPFAEGGSYLVYAREGSTGALGTNLCSRTALLADAAEDLAALGHSSAPLPGDDPDIPAGRGAGWLLVAAAVAAAVVGGLLLARRFGHGRG
jgi:hypothetical protein